MLFIVTRYAKILYNYFVYKITVRLKLFNYLIKILYYEFIKIFILWSKNLMEFFT